MRKPFSINVHRSGADLAMTIMVFVWGLHYIVVKDAIGTLPPLAFNALRFSLGMPLLLTFGLRHVSALRVARRDVPHLLALGLIGPFGYQVLFMLALARTSSTNTALLTSTMPTWIALLTLALGIVMVRRQLIVGIIMSLSGVVLVVVGGSGSGLSVSRSDLIGSALALAAALLSANYTLRIKTLVDRYGGLTIALWTYMISISGLMIIAAPDLVHITADDLPLKVWPNLLFSGLLSCATGFLVENYALRVLGPARISPYYNMTPIVAALGGALLLGDPLTVGVVLGGALTLWGVIVVRRNTLLRLEPTPARVPDHPVQPNPAAGKA